MMNVETELTLNRLKQALAWLRGSETCNEERQVYVRFNWGEIRAVDVNFAECPQWVTIVSVRTDTMDETTLARPEDIIAIRTVGTRRD
jgi:hypothetical protein